MLRPLSVALTDMTPEEIRMPGAAMVPGLPESLMYWISGILAAAALGFVVYGLGLMYDNSYANRIVGGDAYNFIIYSTRGTAYVVAGAVFAVLSVTAAIAGRELSDRRRSGRPDDA